MSTWNLYEAALHATPDYIEKLETIMYEKIRQRTFVKEDEGKALMRAMRYVDSKNTGTLSLEMFAKMLTNIGCVLNPGDVQTLFDHFAEGNGKICCEKLSHHLALKGSGTNPNVKPKFQVQAVLPAPLLAQIKKELIKRGRSGICELRALFSKIDASGSHTIALHDFTWAMKENGHRLQTLEFQQLYKYFDRNNDGIVDYYNFLIELRGPIPPYRTKLIQDIYKMLDKGKVGWIPFELITSNYKGDPHGLFIARFAKQKATTIDFEDYYSDVSALIEKDDIFESFMKGEWKLPEEKVEKIPEVPVKQGNLEEAKAKFF